MIKQSTYLKLQEFLVNLVVKLLQVSNRGNYASLEDQYGLDDSGDSRSASKTTSVMLFESFMVCEVTRHPYPSRCPMLAFNAPLSMKLAQSMSSQ